MVDVAHDDDDGRALDKIFFIVHAVINDAVLNGDDDLALDLSVHLGGDDGRRIKIDRLIDRGHHTEGKQLFDNVRSRALELGSQIADGDLITDGDLNRRFLGALRRDTLQALRLRLPLMGAHALLAVLAGLLLELLLVDIAVGVVAGAGRRRGEPIVLLIVFIQLHIPATGIHAAQFTLGAGLNHNRLLRLGLCRRRRLGVLLRALCFRLLFRSRRLCRRGCLFFLFGGGRLEILIKAVHGAVRGRDDVKDDVQLLLIQRRHRLFIGVGVLVQDLQDLFTLLAKILGDLMRSVFYHHRLVSSRLFNSCSLRANPSSSIVRTAALTPAA